MKRWEQDETTKRMMERIQKMRREIQDVLGDDEKNVIQKAILNDVFMTIAVHLETAIQPQLESYFNAVARHSDDKFTAITKMLTSKVPLDSDGAGFKPVVTVPLQINPLFLDLGPEDLKVMPGYIQMHMVARHYDVALKVYGLTREEKSGDPTGGQTLLFIDLTKSYTQGVEWNSGFYPDLPEQEKKAANKVEVRETIHPKKIARPTSGDFTI